MKFSKWTSWNKRNDRDNINCPGVYLLALFEKNVPEEANILDKNIVYVGETHTISRSLKQRWYEFNNSAFRNKSGHSGGWTYADKISGNGENLYVSVYPVKDMDEKLIPLHIKYIERKIIYEFTLKWGDKPICNID